MPAVRSGATLTEKREISGPEPADVIIPPPDTPCVTVSCASPDEEPE